MLAVKDEREDALAACGGLTILDRCARRDSQDAGNPAQENLEDPIMNAAFNISFPSHDTIHSHSLTLDDIRKQAPAVFAPSAHEGTSARYTFIPTERVLSGLIGAGFIPVEARQTHTRSASPLHARHVLRLRRRLETVQLKDSVPEVVFLNSHDGSSTYSLRMDIFRAVCTNGLIVSRGAFPTVCVAHRGNVVDAVIEGAVRMSDRFDLLAAQVERMEARRLFKDEQLQFAEAALTVRYPDVLETGMRASQLLHCRRIEDASDDLWSTFNRIQENLLGGGLTRRSVNGRLTRTRRLTSIKEDVRINSRLWDLAAQVLAA